MQIELQRRRARVDAEARARIERRAHVQLEEPHRRCRRQVERASVHRQRAVGRCQRSQLLVGAAVQDVTERGHDTPVGAARWGDGDADAMSPRLLERQRHREHEAGHRFRGRRVERERRDVGGRGDDRVGRSDDEPRGHARVQQGGDVQRVAHAACDLAVHRRQDRCQRLRKTRVRTAAARNVGDLEQDYPRGRKRFHAERGEPTARRELLAHDKHRIDHCTTRSHRGLLGRVCYSQKLRTSHVRRRKTQAVAGSVGQLL
mmetsp:Transcript_48923/g.153677  ORF Transcript_48923/g.153677 Transcript_48923/m.153677 type:complete len:260 (-) Transcript_48923:42-821(-)